MRYELIWESTHLISIGEIATIQKGTSITKEKVIKGDIPVIAGGKDIAYYHNVANRDGNIITISASGANAGFVNYFSIPIFASDCYTIKSKNEDTISTKLLYVFLQRMQSLVYGLQKGQAQPHVYGNDIAQIKIPVPSREIQEQIVKEICKVDESASFVKSLVDNKISEIKAIIDRLDPSVSIKEYFDINTQAINPKDSWKNEYFTYIDIDSIGKGDGSISFDKNILGKDAPSRARRVAQDGTVIISTVRPYLKGFAYIENVPDKVIFSTGFALLKSKNEENYISKLLYYLFMFSNDLMNQMEVAMPKTAYPSINKDDIDNFRIPMLSINEQKRIVSEIETLEIEINNARTTMENAANEKQAILDKYL